MNRTVSSITHVHRARIRRAWSSLALAALASVLLGASAHAQNASGAIAGVVTDGQGASLPGVAVTAQNLETGLLRSGVTEGNGRYRLAGLAPGHYRIVADLQGFASGEVADAALEIGAEFVHDFTLGLAGVRESVTVVGQAALVEAARSEVAAVVSQRQIESLPVEGRSAITLALLMPGTSVDTTRAQRPGATVGLAGLSTAGTNYIVDGVNNMISRAGDAREDIPQAAVQEFKVIVSQAPAEYGGRVGGVVNVVTKSGGNQVTGEAFEFFRDKSLNRVDLFQQARHDQQGTPIPDFRRDQLGASVGGPIVRNRLHFYTAFERTDDRQYFTVSTGKPQFYESQEGTFRGGSLSNSIFARTDLQISATQHAFFRYFKQKPTFFSQGSGGTAAAFGSTDTGVPGFSYIAGHTWVASPRVVNELTVMYAESFQTSTLSERYTPSAFANGSARYVFPSFSWGASPGTSFRNMYNQFRDAVSISAGAHSIKLGVGGQILPTVQKSPGNPQGTWTFSTDQYFNPDDPSFRFSALTSPTQFTATLPPFSPIGVSHTYEAYAQDEWHLRPGLTLNLGLRYDLQTRIWNEDFDQSRYPRPLPYVDFASRGDSNNLAPRAGLAWDLRQNGRSVVRAGYGLIYVNMQNSLLDGEISAFKQYSITIRNPSYPDPYQGRDPLSFVSTAPPNITIGANDLHNPEAHTLTAGLSQQLGDSLALHVDGVYSRVNDFPNRVNVNTPDPVTGVRPDPTWGQIVVLKPANGTFDYRALLLRLDRRFSRNVLYTASYTLSKTDNAWTGTSANSNGSITDIFHPGYDQGPADTDRRHNLSLSGAFSLPLGLNLGAVWTFRSTMPFSALAGKDLNNDGFNTDYVPGTTRNQGNRGLDLSLVNAWRAQNGLAPVSKAQIDSSRYRRLDVRLGKTVPLGSRRKLELVAQVFNLLGTDNLGGVGTSQVTNALSDSFGRILTALPRQQAEIGARLVF